MGYNVNTGEITDSSGVIYNIDTGELSVVVDGVSNGGGGGSSSSRYGMSIDNFFGDVDENGVLQAPVKGSFNGTGIRTLNDEAFYQSFYANKTIENFTMPDVASVGKKAFYLAFYSATSLKDVEFTSLEEITTDNAFYSAFQYSSIQSLSFPNLKRCSGQSIFRNACDGCKSLTSVNFDSLENISSSAFGFWGTFNNCTSLESVNFPSLKELGYNGYFDETFSNCTNLKYVNFPVLERLGDASAFKSTFANCTSLSSISFPNLKYADYSSCFGSVSSIYAFRGCTALTEIHFRADMQTKVEGWIGYADKWGATNATIYFDL